jgi:hypothetical protein
MSAESPAVEVQPTPASTSWNPPMPNAPSPPPVGPVSAYNTPDWSAEEVHNVHQALAERGIPHGFEHGDLVVDEARAPFADRVIAELVVTAQHLDGG